MRDVGVQLDAAVGVADGAVLVELAAALIAEAGPQMILAAAAGTAIGQLAAGHGHERALGPFDDLQIADDEGIVERDRAEGLQAVSLLSSMSLMRTSVITTGSPFFCGTGELSCYEQLRTKITVNASLSAAPRSSRAMRSASAASRANAKRQLPLPLISWPAGPVSARRR